MALELQDVSFAYERHGEAVVQGMSATLDAGRICAMIGPNAAGKTTLLRLILGQLRPTQGIISLDSQDVCGLPSAKRAALISYVPQRGLMSFAFTVEQVVAMGRFALTRDEAAIERALTISDLLSIRHRVCRELSSGQQQRVLLARAIAQSAHGGHLMLLDEPSSAMDLRHVHQTMSTLRDLADNGLAVLVVLHDLNLAARYADVIWLMHEGRLAAAGSWQEVLRPQVLEPVYRVGLRAFTSDQQQRPVFAVADSDTMKAP